MKYLFYFSLFFFTSCLFYKNKSGATPDSKVVGVVHQIINESSSSFDNQIYDCIRIDTILNNNKFRYFLIENDVIEFNFFDTTTCSPKYFIDSIKIPKTISYQNYDVSELFFYYFSITEYYIKEPFLYKGNLFSKYADVNIIKYDGSIRYTLVVLLE